MTPTLKAAWLTALRSGHYKQGRGFLHEDEKFCCLGLLCEISGAEWHGEAGELNDLYLGVTDLSSEARNLFGLECVDQITLVSMNDGLNKQFRHTFAEIADWIEENI